MSELPPNDPTSDNTDASSQLLAELADDFAGRCRRGERPSVEEYAQKHPTLAGEIRDLFPAMLLMEQQSGIDPTLTLAPVAERVGATIGRYKLLERIGEGGFGVVFMAEQQHPIRRKVALKVIKAGMDTKQVIGRFEAERQALTMMDHPNIAKVLDAGATDAGRPYFVMELVKGVPITDYCDQARLTTRERLELMIQVCNAVQHAHTKGVIHRDLKPTNVLVTLHDDKPVPKVIDFGIAKATGQQLTELTLFTNYAQMLGTPLYMSPEQAQISGLDVDTRSDVYSLGVLLYELLTGTTPFDKQRLRSAAYDEMRRIIREEEPPKPSTRLSTLGEKITAVSADRQTDPRRLSQIVHGELDWIVMKALEKDRTRRYETANGLARDIERHLADEPVQACPPTARYRLRKLARRYRVPLTVAAAFVLLLGAASVISTREAIRAGKAERLAEARLSAETAARGQAMSESAKAGAISNLLQEALRSANPDGAKGTEYTVRQLLEDLSLRLGNQLNDQPEAKAAIHATIGNAYRNLRQMPVAEFHLQKALQIRRSVLGPNHPDVAQSLLDHSYNAFENADTTTAEAEAREALTIFQTNRIEDERMLSAYALLGFYVGHQGRGAEAQALADQAFAFARKTGFTEHRELAKILQDLAPLKTAAGDSAGAVQLASQAVAMHRRVSGNDHPETGWALWTLGIALENQGKLPEAEANLRQALQIFRKQYDYSHKSIRMATEALRRVLSGRGDSAALAALDAEKAAHVSKALQHGTDLLKVRIELGAVLRGTGNLDGALANLNTAMQLANEATPDLKYSLAKECSLLAKLLSDKQRLQEAERTYRQIISLREPIDDETRPDIRLAQSMDYNDLAFVLVRAKRLADAESAIRAALKLKQDLVRQFPDSRDYQMHLVHSYLGLGYITRACGQTSNAVQAYGEATALLDVVAADARGPEVFRNFLAQTLRQLSDAWFQQGHFDEAEHAQQQALKCFEGLAASYPANRYYPQEQGFSHRILGNIAEKAGRTADAELHFRDSLNCYRNLVARAPDSPSYRDEAAVSTQALADLLLRARKYDQAEPLLLAEYEELSTHTSERHAARLREVLTRTVALYRDWGKTEKVAQWQGTLLEVVDRGIARSPKDMQLQLLRGRLLADAGEAQEALAQFSQVLAVAPQLSDAWTARAFIYFRRQQWAKAIADFSKAVDLAPQVHTNWFHRGHAYIQLAQWDKAAADFTKVVEQWPNEPEGWYLRGIAYAQMGKPKEALSDLKQGVAKGFKDVGRMKSDPNFESLRGTEEFKKLLIDVERERE